MKSFSKREADRRTFLEQVRESKENGYLLSSKKIGSGAFSKVYLGYATQEKMMQNYKLASDLRNKRHSMVSPGVGPEGAGGCPGSQQGWTGPSALLLTPTPPGAPAPATCSCNSPLSLDSY